MSSVYDDPALLDGVIEQCVEWLATHRTTARDEWRLIDFDSEAFTRSGGSLPGLLAPLMQERSKGEFTILAVDSALVRHPLGSSVYFVRVPDDNTAYAEPVEELAAGMVLCEVNLHRATLSAGIAHNSPEEVARIKLEREATKRTEALRAARSAERRAFVEEEFAHVVSRVELALQRVPSEEARRKWALMRSPHTSHQGHITVEDLIELAFMLQMPVQNFFERPPITT